MKTIEKLNMMQFRYYDDDSEKNCPAGDVKTFNFFCNETSFTVYAPIQQLGIQTLPGTKFYLNQSLDPIIIGGTGIFELDLRNTTAILSSLRFDKASMLAIKNNPEGYLIVDFVYGGEG